VCSSAQTLLLACAISFLRLHEHFLITDQHGLLWQCWSKSKMIKQPRGSAGRNQTVHVLVDNVWQ